MFEGVVGVLLGALLLLLDVVVALLGCAVLSARRPGNRRVLGWLNLGGACLAFAISLVALPGELNEPAILTGRALGAQAVIVALILLPVGQVVLGRALVASRRVRAATHGGFAVMGVAWLASGLHAVWHYPHRTVLGVSLPDLRALGPVSVRTLLEIDAELKRGSYERCFDLFSVTRDEVRPLPEFRSVQAACVGHLVARLHANHPLPDDGPFVTADNFVEKAMSDRSSMLKAPLDYDIVQQLLAAPKRPPDPGWARVLDGQLALVEVERAIYVRGTGAYVQLRVSSMCDAQNLDRRVVPDPPRRGAPRGRRAAASRRGRGLRASRGRRAQDPLPLDHEHDPLVPRPLGPAGSRSADPGERVPPGPSRAARRQRGVPDGDPGAAGGRRARLRGPRPSGLEAASEHGRRRAPRGGTPRPVRRRRADPVAGGSGSPAQ